MRRNDGLLVPLVFIRSMKRSRSYFYGAVVDALFEVGTDVTSQRNLRLSCHASLHIECFSKNEVPIVGNMLDCLDKKQFDAVYDDVVASYIGHKSKVWGYRTPYKYAELVGDANTHA